MHLLSIGIGRVKHVSGYSYLANLLGLLVGVALLSDHFEKSEVPSILPNFLPDDWKGGFVLLCIIFVLSAFWDNTAAALIGATIAQTVFRKNLGLAP